MFLSFVLLVSLIDIFMKKESRINFFTYIFGAILLSLVLRNNASKNKINEKNHD